VAYRGAQSFELRYLQRRLGMVALARPLSAGTRAANSNARYGVLVDVGSSR
jgi:hypothetical protein